MKLRKNQILSPAKLNVGLRIVGRRQDGFHLLESLFWPIDLCDELTVSDATTKHTVAMEWATDLPRTDLDPIEETENVVWKILDRFSPRKFFNVSIKKRIPVGGGLGGGSSNAGTLLSYLKKNFPTEETDKDQVSKFGADIPFFLNPKPSWVSGIGEQIQALEIAQEVLREICFVVVLLPKGNSTPQVFSAYRQSKSEFSAKSSSPSHPISWNELKTYLSDAKNDLAEAAIDLYPLIGETIHFLKALPSNLHADLSGSGSTCYALFASKIAAEKNIKEITKFCREHLCKGIIVRTFGLSP